MNNGNEPATAIEFNGFGQYAPSAHAGLTKREHFAAMAPDVPTWYDTNETDFIKRYFAWRCFYANSMLMALEETC